MVVTWISHTLVRMTRLYSTNCLSAIMWHFCFCFYTYLQFVSCTSFAHIFFLSSYNIYKDNLMRADSMRDECHLKYERYWKNLFCMDWCSLILLLQWLMKWCINKLYRKKKIMSFIMWTTYNNNKQKIMIVSSIHHH